MTRTYHPAPPSVTVHLACSTCGRSLTTRVVDDPAAWPLHRCTAGAIRPFDRKEAA